MINEKIFEINQKEWKKINVFKMFTKYSQKYINQYKKYYLIRIDDLQDMFMNDLKS